MKNFEDGSFPWEKNIGIYLTTKYCHDLIIQYFHSR